jgi:CspA family cold shock protein
MNGTVRWYNKEHGFGFIAPVSGGLDIFVEESGVIDPPLEKKQQVSFEVGTSSCGEFGAVNVEKRF